MQLSGNRTTALGRPSTLRGAPLLSRAARRQSRAAQAPTIKAVLEINRPASASSSNGAEAASAKEDIKREMHYRIVTEKADEGKLYQSLAWSVHNRLVDAFERTDAYWK